MTFTKIEPFEDFRNCAFCRTLVDVSPAGVGVVVTVERAGRWQVQELYAHPGCLDAVCEPFDPEIFG